MKITRFLSAISLVGLMASPALADIVGPGAFQGATCSVGDAKSSLAAVAMFASGALVLRLVRRSSRKAK
jgi:hypothetical protein